MQTSKVTLYLLIYLIGLGRTEFSSKPFVGMLIALTFVTSVYSIAQRNYVSWHSTGTIRRRQRYPMIHSDGVPQTTRPATYSTTMVKIIKSALPIPNRKNIGEASLAGAAALRICANFIRIVPSCFIRIAIFPSSIVFLYFISGSFAIVPLGSRHFFSMFLPPIVYTLSFFFKITTSIILVSFRMPLVPFPIEVMCTITAIVLIAIFISFMFIESRNRLDFTAFCAALREDCIHSMFLLLCPIEVAARAVELSAFSLIRLGRTPSIPLNHARRMTNV